MLTRPSRDMLGTPFRWDRTAAGDDAIINDAVFSELFQEANVEGAELYAPPGTYVVTENIPNFHDVSKKGLWAVRRGTDTFYCNPTRSQTNKLYVSSSGDTANDGLTADFPVTLARAAAIIRDKGPLLDGTWQVILAAGTYSRDTFVLGNIFTRQRIELIGPATGDFRTVPTAILDGENLEGDCIGGDGQGRFLIKDTKIINWCDTTPDYNGGGFAGTGVNFTGAFRVELENVHVDRCDCAWYLKGFLRYFAKGGIISNCGAGIQELFGVVREFRGAGSSANRTTIQNSEFAIKAKELCTGHTDFVELVDNDYGVHFSRCCTGNLSDAVIKRNGVGVYCVGGSSYVDLRVDWGTGADANTVKSFTDGSSMNISRGAGENEPTDTFSGKGAKLVGTDVTELVHTGTTADTLVASLHTSEIGDFQAAGEFYEGVAYGSATLASPATIRFRLGGSGASVITMPAGSYAWKLYWRLTSRGPDTQIAFMELNVSGSNPVMANNARTYAFSTTAFLMGLYVQLGSASDTVQVQGVHLYTSEM